MGERYRCSDEARRTAVRDHPTLNGIDYLEVLDTDAPAGSPRQQTLLVHCFKPVPTLTADNVSIEGGVRISPVRAQWAFPAPAVPPDRASQPERDLFAALPDAGSVLVVRTHVAGDFSTYRLSIAPSKEHPELTEDFDPELSAVDFSFKVECPNDFDCLPAAAVAAGDETSPGIDYLAKDYASFRRLMLDRLAFLLPEWTERNPADLGVALVEILAYAADELSYYQDAVATEAYLGTARRRVSVRRHARLLDYPLHDGINARAWVQLEVEEGSLADGQLPIPAGTLLLTRVDGQIVLDPAAVEEAVAAGAQVFETMHDRTAHAAHAELRFYTWGDDRCELLAGATRATFADPDGNLQLAPGDVVIFEEVLGPSSGSALDADPTRRHPVRLTRVKPRQDPLTAEAVVEVEWDPADAPPFGFCLSTVIVDEGGERPVADLTVARGNVVLVDHGRTVGGERLSAPPVGSSRPYRPRLSGTDVTWRVPFDPEVARSRPASEATRQDGRAAMAAVDLDQDGQPWTVRRDLLASDRFAADVVVETEDDGTATLRFGDGTLGRAPTEGVGLTATYRVGSGRAGNVGAGAIVHVAAGPGGLPPGIVGVSNPLPATGGADPETIDQVRRFAPEAFRTQERAVTEADYAGAAQRHPQVQRAVATFRWTGSWRTVFVTVDRRDGAPVDEAFAAEMREFLSQYRMAGEDLEVEAPQYVPLEVALTVCVAPGVFAMSVERDLLRVFGRGELPAGRRAFFHPDNFTFGQPVYLSQVIRTAMEVPGVQWVDVDDTPPKPNRFRRWGQASRGEVAAGLIDLDRLEIARLDNDPSQPENGRIRFFMEGGL